MIGFLTKEERAMLIEKHRREQVKRQADRIKTLLLLDEGMSYDKVAKIL